MESSFVTLTAAAERGDCGASDALFAALYTELHRIAKRQLAHEGFAISLGVTTLLHQAYIEIASQDTASFENERHFMNYAARVMRCLIIDHARKRCALKRNGGFELTLVPNEIPNAIDDRELLGIGEALDELARVEPELAEIVDLRFFCGFTFAEIALMRNVSERTVQRYWEKARIYLHRNLRNLEI